MNIPFLDLKLHHQPLREEILAAIGEVIDTCAFAGGPFVAKFEEEFAAFCHAPHAIGVGNGTDALWLALLALGVGPGDEVITAPTTFMATAEAISFCGARPVFVDVEEDTYNLDPRQLERALSPRTKAVIPVHLFGQTADMDPILDFARKQGLPVVEDASQAHGAKYKARSAGTLGTVGCFSFYPGKNLGALGEAGAVVTGDASLAASIRVLREHGQTKKYYHSKIGWNARMDGMQAAALRVKLRRLAGWTEARRAHAARYIHLLEGVRGLVLPRPAAYAHHVYHVFAVRLAKRDEVLAEMGRRGISCGIHYPVPVHRQVAYEHLGLGPGSFPVAERCAEEFLSLPMYPELTAQQIQYVADNLREVVEANLQGGLAVGPAESLAARNRP